MVIVPDLPDDPAAWVGFLRDLDYFDRIQLTEADFKRAETYRIQGQRRELRERAASLEDFLASLQQTVTIQPLNEASLGRAAQMCQRTNQFNLTTRRYTVADLDAMQRDPDIEVFVLSVKDRFGDSGITGLAVLRFAGDAAEIDTLLLSCRVLGRRIEDAFLAFLAERARTRGARALKGRYLPTPKNAQVARFYPVRGFAETGENVYEFPLDGEAAAFPPEISLEVLVDA
jgi:FkbH-like protein